MAILTVRTVVMNRRLVEKSSARVITLSAIIQNVFSSLGFVTELMIVEITQMKTNDTPVGAHNTTVRVVSGCVLTLLTDVFQ
jgi:hypothetical protein